MFLLDTHIVVDLRKAKSGHADAGLTAWASGIAPRNLFISALSLLEIESAIAHLEDRDKTAVSGLKTWLDEQVMTAFDGRILPIDAAVVRKRAQISIADARDALVAATAAVHGLTLVTRHAQAYKAGRLKTFNPWGFTPDASGPPDEWRDGTDNGPLWFRNLFLR